MATTYGCSKTEYVNNSFFGFPVWVVFFICTQLTAQIQIIGADISFEFPSKNVTGTISGFESTSIIDIDSIENSKFIGSVTAKTLDTNNGLRNWSLRGGKYFDVDDYPKIKFESAKVIQTDSGLEVTGDLTLKGTSKPITIVFVRKGNQLMGSTSLYCIDYGIKIKKKREDNLVKVNFLFDLN
ncbi:MAG: YceI family protein [Bacteroidota bacterium]